MSTLLNMQMLWHSYDRQIEVHKKTPIVARGADTIREAASSINNVKDFLNNKTVFNYVLKAYGMEDIPYEAMIEKLLVGGTKDPKSFANSFTDAKYKKFVNDMGFEDGKNGHFNDPDFVESVIQKYELASFEEHKGNEDVNTRLAMYFERNVSSVSSWYEVFADKALSEVVFTAFGYSKETRLGDLDKLVDMMEKRMPLSDFKDPAKVKSIVQRFAIFSESENMAQSSPILQLFAGVGGGFGREIIHIDPAALSAASRMRYL